MSRHEHIQPQELKEDNRPDQPPHGSRI
jgi:hypothetical protein